MTDPTARPSDTEVAAWLLALREYTNRLHEFRPGFTLTHGAVQTMGMLAGLAEKIHAELAAERQRAAGRPTLAVEWRKDAPCGYPHVDIRHNGMRAVGWVVPDGLEDRLPSFLDGVTMPANPFLPPLPGSGC